MGAALGPPARMPQGGGWGGAGSRSLWIHAPCGWGSAIKRPPDSVAGGDDTVRDDDRLHVVRGPGADELRNLASVGRRQHECLWPRRQEAPVEAGLADAGGVDDGQEVGRPLLHCPKEEPGLRGAEVREVAIPLQRGRQALNGVDDTIDVLCGH